MKLTATNQLTKFSNCQDQRVLVARSSRDGGEDQGQGQSLPAKMGAGIRASESVTTSNNDNRGVTHHHQPAAEADQRSDRSGPARQKWAAK